MRRAVSRFPPFCRVLGVLAVAGGAAGGHLFKVTPDLWWLGGVFMIIANVFYGTATATLFLDRFCHVSGIRCAPTLKKKGRFSGVVSFDTLATANIMVPPFGLGGPGTIRRGMTRPCMVRTPNALLTPRATVGRNVICMICVIYGVPMLTGCRLVPGVVVSELGLPTAGTAFLLYEAWLPLLAENHWEVRDMAPGPERADKVVTLIDRISNYGFIYGFAGGLSCLIICFPFVLYSSSIFGDEATGIRVAVVIAGVWWFTIQFYTFANLKTRPGPPLPEGTRSYFVYSWGRFFDTMGRVPKMPTTMRYMILWFFYSDGVNTIANTAVLAMGVMIRWCYVSKSVALLAMLAGLPIFSVVGLYIASWIMKKWGVSAKSVVFSALLIVSLIPIYGLIGFWTDDWGLHYGFEVVIIACVFGLCFGVVVAYSRSIMAQLIPPGYEAQFFSIFEITNRGSSWLGPVVVSQVYKQTGELRYAFIYILATTLIPALLLGMLDIEDGRKRAQEYAQQHPVIRDTLVPEKKKITKNTYL